MAILTPCDVVQMKLLLEKELGLLGFEFHPLKISWYNALIQPVFRLDYDEDTLAFLIISTPSMFENSFIPFLKNTKDLKQQSVEKDPIDKCMVYHLSKVKELLSHYSIKMVYDFELHPNRRPKIIMQSMAHASGAAYFYHPSSINNLERQDWTIWKDKKMYGVSIHSKYGGWFALRAVAIFEDVTCPGLPRTLPNDVVPNNVDRIKLLQFYNFNWKDGKYRDIIPVSEKYSDLQIKYFSIPPGNRNEIIKSILNSNVQNFT